MQLTKNEIQQKRAELVKVLLNIEELKKEKMSLENTLDKDFTKNEAAYREGVLTKNGVLMRKPSWKSAAKRNVLVA